VINITTLFTKTSPIRTIKVPGSKRLSALLGKAKVGGINSATLVSFKAENNFSVAISGFKKATSLQTAKVTSIKNTKAITQKIKTLGISGAKLATFKTRLAFATTNAQAAVRTIVEFWS
jgi:hypothetical protein